MKRLSVVAVAAALAASAFTRPTATISQPAKPPNDYTPPQFKRPDRKQWRGKKRGRK